MDQTDDLFDARNLRRCGTLNSVAMMAKSTDFRNTPSFPLAHKSWHKSFDGLGRLESGNEDGSDRRRDSGYRRRQCCTRFRGREPIDGSDPSRLCVIIEKLFANLYEHGGVTHDELVKMSLSTSVRGVRIVVVDPGCPFDPRDAKSSKRRSERGGAGIAIVRSRASQFDYRRSEGRNRLELLVPLRGTWHGHPDGTEPSS